jgi:hypothetical protein
LIVIFVAKLWNTTIANQHQIERQFASEFDYRMEANNLAEVW